MLNRMVTRLRSLLVRPGARQKNARTLFFLHIRKTAGTALNHLLAMRCHGPRCRFHAHFGPAKTGDFDGCELVEGHAGFEFLSRFRSRPIILVMLRHPVDRAISSFYYNRAFAHKLRSGQTPGFDFSQRRRQLIERSAELGLPDLIRREPELAEEFLGNEQTRALAGIGSGPAEPHLEQALSNLHQCHVVGLTERFEESAQLVCRYMRWQPFREFPKLNVTSGRPRVEELDAETRGLLEQMLGPDIALYENAAKLFEHRLAQALARPAVAARIPRLGDYTFDQPMIGGGWHSREHDGRNWFCWTGGSQTSWLEFRPPEEDQHDHELQCQLCQSAPSRVAESVRLSINGEPVPLSLHASAGRTVLNARISAATLSREPGKMRVEFTVGEHWRPCDLDSSSSDNRQLGIALQRLSLKRAA